MKKLRLREDGPFAQAQTASPGQDWSLNPGQPTSHTMLLHSTLPATERGDQEDLLYVLETKGPGGLGLGR